MKILALLFLLLIGSISYSQKFNYYPTSTTGDTIKHHYYGLSYSEKHEQAEWVAYMLTEQMLDKKVDRKTSFRQDTMVRSFSASNEDYKKSGFDKGHLAPAADFRFDTLAMAESFLLSNISPQEPSFNRGCWQSLEDSVRNWALELDTIYVVTAGILKSIKVVIGENKVSVPFQFYKIILDYSPKYPLDANGIAFLMPNEACSHPLKSYACSIDMIEQLTGIDFFPALPDTIEDDIEKKIEIEHWFK